MNSFKELLKQDKLIRLIGIHDALSAELVQRAGFEGLWLSSFELHASACLPDADILGINEYAEAVNKICDRVDIPLLVDGDCGGGSPINTIRMVREYEKNGASGICIEDNLYPKRCSFYDDVKRKLAEPEAHANKIRAAVDARKGEFFVVARTEALIVGAEIKEAIERAETYVSAGADAILIHSKSKDYDDVAEFLDKWNHHWLSDVPVICVPTTYSKVKESELRHYDVRFVIYANALIRASVAVQEMVLEQLDINKRLSTVEDLIVDMDKVFDLISVKKLQENERKYS